MNSKSPFSSAARAAIFPILVYLSVRSMVPAILYNLTVNALKALKNTPDPKLEWKAETRDGIVLISISDNGPGITHKQAEALYNKEASIGTKSGLGLHIIRDLADAIQCSIIVDSGPNTGTMITLRLQGMETTWYNEVGYSKYCKMVYLKECFPWDEHWNIKC